MRTADVIEGITILQKYRAKRDGYDIGCEHDALYAYATTRPLETADLARMIELGWFQEDVDYDGDFSAEHYDPAEGWTAYV